MIKYIINLISSWFSSSKDDDVDIQPIEVDKKLSDEDYEQASKLLNCETAAIKAVISVETGGRGGFLLNADIPERENNLNDYSEYPVILFEGHIFYKQLKKKGIKPEDYINENTKDIIYKSWTKAYYGTKWDEYMRLEKAYEIDEEAALLSCSYGLGQIMGFNYNACGYNTVDEFVNDMQISEGKQLLAFCNFIKSNAKLYKSLKAKDWATFAYNYNGPEYYKNSYDKKLEKAYNKNKK